MKFSIFIPNHQTLSITPPAKYSNSLLKGIKASCYKLNEVEILIQKFESESILHHLYLPYGGLQGKISTPHEGMAIIYLIKGSQISFNDQSLTEHECLICYFPKNTPISLQSKDPFQILILQLSIHHLRLFKNYYPKIGLYLEALSSKAKKLMISKTYPIDFKIQKWLQKIIDFNMNDPTLRNLSFKAYIDQIYIAIIKILQRMQEVASEVCEQKKLYLETKEYLLSHLNQNITIQHLSNKFFTNPHKIRSLFFEYEGMTIGQFYLQQRLEKAKELLKTTDLSIHMIAEMVGYQSPNNFSLAFKEKFKMTPSQYKVKNASR